uniref:Uncharacterized protein n=1 Tax=Arundo donax TaxID=35708 RepID=A0A0A9F386_ARUDO
MVYYDIELPHPFVSQVSTPFQFWNYSRRPGWLFEVSLLLQNQNPTVFLFARVKWTSPRTTHKAHLHQYFASK